MSGLRRVFRSGQALGGWCCADCHTQFWHEGKPRRTYPRVVAHLIWRHRRLPIAGLPASLGHLATKYGRNFEWRAEQ